MQADMPNTHVVVHDPENVYWEGGLVDAEQVVPQLRARGVVTLPVEPALILVGAVCGYFRRSWGSGWPVGTPVPKFACPMVLFVRRGDGLKRISWAAKLVAESRDAADAIIGHGRLLGSLRLAADSGQPGVLSGGFAPGPNAEVDMARLRSEQVKLVTSPQGLIVYGDGQIESPADVMFGCGLYGAVPGVRVAWAAVSQSR